MKNHLAILEGHTVIPIENCKIWAQKFEPSKRRVAVDQVGEAEVSTVFLGLNHGTDDSPLWFETMIFGGQHDQFQDRWKTWDQAEKGHQNIVALLKNGIDIEFRGEK